MMRKRFQTGCARARQAVDAGLFQDIRAAHSLLSDGLPHADGPCWSMPTSGLRTS